MSSNKNKWWTVTTTKVVAAPNKSEALRLASNRRTVVDTVVEQIPAYEARAMTEAKALNLVVNMIGKDEVTRFLRPVLEHIRPIADTIVFTDDASTDGTPQVAAEYCDSVIKLSESIFSTDEGMLRQISWDHLEQHAQEGDWVLALDCDEMFFGAQHLASYFDQNRFDVLGVTFFHMWNETQYRVDKLWAPTISSRLFRFRRGGEFRQRKLACGAEPTYVEQAMMRGRFQPNTPFRMKHLGYVRDEDKIAKHERYMKLDGGAYHNRSHLESIVDRNPALKDWVDE